MRLYFCYKYKTNQLYHVSKEDVKWLSYLGVQYYSFHESNFWEKIKLKEKNLSHKDVIKKDDITLSFPWCQAQNKFISQYKEMNYNKTLFFVGGHSLYLTHDPSWSIMLLALPRE